tara:strand:+ start:2274 stop:2471 length:198 start_codon:yes stop_codon:yes gene_type:complete
LVIKKKGNLVLKNHPTLGFALDKNDGTETGRPSHLGRNLSLEQIDEVSAKLTTWKLFKSAKSWPE